jgi:hypothetical protein
MRAPTDRDPTVAERQRVGDGDDLHVARLGQALHTLADRALAEPDLLTAMVVTGVRPSACRISTIARSVSSMRGLTGGRTRRTRP